MPDPRGRGFDWWLMALAIGLILSGFVLPGRIVWLAGVGILVLTAASVGYEIVWRRRRRSNRAGSDVER